LIDATKLLIIFIINIKLTAEVHPQLKEAGQIWPASYFYKF